MATIVASAAAILSFAAPAHAQQRLRLGLAGGVTAPGAETSKLNRAGGHALVAAWYDVASRLISRVRVDASVHRLAGKTLWGEKVRDVDLFTASAGAERDVLRTRAVQPYLVAGTATHNLDQGGGREFHFGLNAGAGVRFPLGRVTGLVEARYYQVYTGEPNGFIPISVGLSF